ncbi:tyrosine-type recombinase/integrase [Roseibium aggregatum]|uniref:tyrosine-type recombinase/integrase n=1 Tax=Roseibium aggregatum TaxID=187304 RepID=UPI0009F976D3|nr:site-specific integrase [Roseibium aggregatum]UFI04650.1 site-specific integrase [Roseibium aggregatum]
MPRPADPPKLKKRKNRPFYFIVFHDPETGKRRECSTGTSNRDEAEEKLEDFLRDRRTQRTGRPVPPHKMKIAQTLDDYANFKMGKKAAERLSYSLSNLLTFWQDKTVDQINPETVEQYWRTSSRKRSTCRRDLTDLRSAVNHSIRMNRLQEFRFPELPKDGKPRKRWLTQSEYVRLFWAAGDEYRSKFTLRLFLMIAYYTGARKSAIMELEWSQIDFDAGMLNFNKDGAEFDEVDDSEGGKPRSHIPMPPELSRHLKRRFDLYGDKTNFVFHQKHNPTRRVKSIDKGFRQAAKKAGLKKVTPHTLRHTRVSLLVQAGEKISDVSEYMAMSFQTLEKVYSHFNTDHIRDMAQRLGRSRNARGTKSREREVREKSENFENKENREIA